MLFRSLGQKFRPLFAQEMANMDRDMFAVLTDDQAKLWKTRMERVRGPRGPWRGGPPGSGGPWRGGPPGTGRERGEFAKPGAEHKSDGHQPHPSGEKLPANQHPDQEAKPQSTSPAP